MKALKMPPLELEFHSQIKAEYARMAASYGLACWAKLVLDRATPDQAYELARWAASYGLDALNWRER